jgi:2'-5' RNA ligase
VLWLYTVKFQMRLFVGVDISEEVRTKLRALVGRLRPIANLKWTPVENLHVTTKFIGEWPQERLEEIKTALDQVPKPGLVEVAVRGLGWFPNPHNPRVFWAGVQAEDTLKSLAGNTERALTQIGVAVENREFHPHLTLARMRDGLSKESLGALRRAVAAEETPDFGTFHAAVQILFLSAGGKYTKLYECSLLS